MLNPLSNVHTTLPYSSRTAISSQNTKGVHSVASDRCQFIAMALLKLIIGHKNAGLNFENGRKTRRWSIAVLQLFGLFVAHLLLPVTAGILRDAFGYVSFVVGYFPVFFLCWGGWAFSNISLPKIKQTNFFSSMLELYWGEGEGMCPQVIHTFGVASRLVHWGYPASNEKSTCQCPVLFFTTGTGLQCFQQWNEYSCNCQEWSICPPLFQIQWRKRTVARYSKKNLLWVPTLCFLFGSS